MDTLLEKKREQFPETNPEWIREIITKLWTNFQRFKSFVEAETPDPEIQEAFDTASVGFIIDEPRSDGYWPAWIHPLTVEFPDTLIDIIVKHPVMAEYLYEVDLTPHMVLWDWDYDDAETLNGDFLKEAQYQFPFLYCGDLRIGINCKDQTRFSFSWTVDDCGNYPVYETGIVQTLKSGLKRQEEIDCETYSIKEHELIVKLISELTGMN